MTPESQHAPTPEAVILALADLCADLAADSSRAGSRLGAMLDRLFGGDMDTTWAEHAASLRALVAPPPEPRHLGVEHVGEGDPGVATGAEAVAAVRRALTAEAGIQRRTAEVARGDSARVAGALADALAGVAAALPP